ncbi:MAG: hypothetical protein HUU08_09505 [Candidatus Brocadia sp.]|nr:hypothetical protein [Candidatus Brocadia sp.]UJS17489.1 MAG: hypothetical protein L3J17_00110 [Candidatus Jettenia sp.]
MIFKDDHDKNVFLELLHDGLKTYPIILYCYALCKETSKSFDEIKREWGILRQIAMDLLYRVGRLSGTEIGEMMGIDYSTVSQGRKRLREKLKNDTHISQIIKSVEIDLSTIFDPIFSFSILIL